MIPLSVKEIAEACAGRIDGADPDAIVSHVVVDSRAVVPGALFVALEGEHADGHAFAADALQRGAVAVVARDDASEIEAAVRVTDPREAMGSLATFVRSRLRLTTIAITGSSGKTGTKDLTAAACGKEKRTAAAFASYNNEIGVPLTIFEANEDTDVLVIEVGSRGIGHIASLEPMIRPDVAVVTNIGPAHIGMFGSLDNTALAKGELVEMLQPDGTAVLNADDERVDALATKTNAHVVRFGRAASADVRAEGVSLDGDARATFTLVAGDERAEVTLRIPGEHMVSNALAAAAAARAAGVSLQGAADGLARAEGSAWRMELHDVGGRRILNDAYNANPDSMAAALKALVAMSRGRPSWAVLGPMAELGDETTAAHDRVGRLAVRLGVTHLVTIGEDARAVHEAARLEGMFGGEAIFAATIEDALALLHARMEPDAVVLVKASRAAGLERLARALEVPDA
ncbi:MAG TPA: UDP-N-acetylmuramoyl-tripeptide--D-alanyl-D-alanine ligase [Actinomycetota bacterium]|nr:UDP-N-acetylmuramoyl-tripeptide--D-alanyl-D-alanine ligase [Actinomycetota bacterium]